MSAKEYADLPKEIKDKLPLIDVLQRFTPKNAPPIEKTLKIIFARALSQLVYFDFGEEELKKAIKKFQRDVGEKQTGVLTAGQAEKLMIRAERISDTPITLPGYGETLRVYGDNNHIFTNGTWRIEGDKIMYPLNYSKINCHKSIGTCEALQIDFNIPRLDKSNSSKYFFMITEDIYQIISWTDSEVISKSAVNCRQTIMTIDKSNNEVFQITKNRGTKGCDTGIAKFPPLKVPRISKLYPSYVKSNEFWEKRKKETDKFMNPDYQNLIKTYLKAEKEFKKKKQ